MNKLHFSLGENAGQLLVDIAREHLLCKYNPAKALSSIKNSINCSEDIALDIIIGKMLLFTDKDGVTFNGIEYNHEIHKDIYPRLDIEGWVEEKLLETKETAEEWLFALRELRTVILRNNGEFDFYVNYNNLIKFFYTGNSENLIDISNDKLGNIKGCVIGVRNFIEETMKLLHTIKWLSQAYPDKIFEENSFTPIEVVQLNTQLFDFMDANYIGGSFKSYDSDMVSVETYIDNQLEINKIIEKGLKPVEITDGYDAGWLSPEGLYYGLNGDIANMLHIQISDALLANGIIPKEFGGNPCMWLEENCWVKIHGNWILFDGWNQHIKGKQNIPLTKQQHNSIERYGKLCCDGVLRLGYNKETLSASRFGMTDILMLRKYFGL